MKAFSILAWLALFALTGCLDSIVGTECASGYSLCGGMCVTTGDCLLPDAGDPLAGKDGSIESAHAFDSTTLAETPSLPSDGGATDSDLDQMDAGEADAPAIDNAPEQPSAPDAFVPPDAKIRLDASADAPISLLPDVAAPSEIEDAPTQVRLSEDASLPCVDCLDAMDDAPGSEDVEPAVDGTLAESNDAIESDGENPLDALAPGGENPPDASESDGENPLDATEADGEDDASEPLTCSQPQTLCNNLCVFLDSDPDYCGDCNTWCASQVCTSGKCLVCAAEEAVCHQQCTAIATDPDNCGACDSSCANGLCSNGKCEAPGTGRAIVIGHDYLNNRLDMNHILSNAVFLWPTNPIRLLAYEGSANPTAIAGANAAISQVAVTAGRQVQRIVAQVGDVSAQLALSDVFLIYGQEGAVDADFASLAQTWKDALLTFVNRGGTVVLLDGYYAMNNGTCQILDIAGLFSIARGVSTTNSVCTVVTRGDALATGLPQTYRCERNSVDFLPGETGSAAVTTVVTSGGAVVLHKIF